MAEHAETFLSLYQADMDAALQVQPVDSWDSFPLFQLHNNFLRTDRECHLSQTQLCFKLIVITCLRGIAAMVPLFDSQNQ